ncbi:uncharacterized protein LOC134279813 [Saccostrea cucullata]|uniref:uncharacterized protein LOC134279813 n=1 Tax=Saccostrea cuccullata TaxID=36930 RepID=UPI002ED5EB30
MRDQLLEEPTVASPRREPCYLKELTTDESEVVELQMGYFKDNKICTSSQTEKVVVIQDETEITDLLAKQNEAKKRKTVSTQTDSLTSCEASVQKNPMVESCLQFMAN